MVVGSIPSEVNAKEPFNGTHEIDWNKGGQDSLELSFHGRVFGEVYEVIDAEADCNR